MIFKTRQLSEEWNSFKIRHELKNMVNALDGWCQRMGLPEVVVTSLLRDDLKSQHSRGEAADIRAHGLRLEQGAKIINYLTEMFFRRSLRPDGRQNRCVYCHGEGDNLHFHLSIDRQDDDSPDGQPT